MPPEIVNDPEVKAKQIARARDLYGSGVSGEIQITDHSPVAKARTDSSGREYYWVRAWLWVYPED